MDFDKKIDETLDDIFDNQNKTKYKLKGGKEIYAVLGETDKGYKLIALFSSREAADKAADTFVELDHFQMQFDEFEVRKFLLDPVIPTLSSDDIDDIEDNDEF